jgi:hypothetical protein
VRELPLPGGAADRAHADTKYVGGLPDRQKPRLPGTARPAEDFRGLLTMREACAPGTARVAWHEAEGQKLDSPGLEPDIVLGEVPQRRPTDSGF